MDADSKNLQQKCDGNGKRKEHADYREKDEK